MTCRAYTSDVWDENGRFKVGVFAIIVHHLRELLRVAAGRKGQPTATIFDSRTIQSTPEGGGRAGYDGAKPRKDSKVHLPMNTLVLVLA